MDVVWYILLFALLCAGFLLTLMTLPGNWLMIVATALYARLTHWQILSWKVILILVILGIAGEIVETVAGGAGAKRAGGTRRGTIGALIGAVLGGIFFTGLIPIPIVGTVIGVLVGVFVGAVLFELSGGRRTDEALAVGLGATHGRFVGMLIKVGFAGVIFLVGTFAGFPVKHSL
jgi:uncharacterized protein YqgC (DUF456 family)